MWKRGFYSEVAKSTKTLHPPVKNKKIPETLPLPNGGPFSLPNPKLPRFYPMGLVGV